jgi:hypothetical protein
MKYKILLPVIVALTFALSTGALAETIKASGKIELKDAAGDVTPITTSGKDHPGFDVVKLSITSDGKLINFGALLKDPPGSFATSALVLYFDVDQNPATGARLDSYGKPNGFEYKGELKICMKYENGVVACTGGSSKSKVKSRYAGMDLYRLKGSSESNKESIVDSMGFPGRKPAVKTPVTGNEAKGTLEYEDLGLKSGQTVRILVSEACSPRAKSLFPEILLTLK